MLTIKISKDGNLLETLENQSDVGNAMNYLLRIQPKDCQKACREDGYEVEIKDNETGNIRYW